MRVTINDIRNMKLKGEKIPTVTAYDYTTAKIVDEAGIPLILVGDSLGMVVLGYETTIPVTMQEMLHHTKAVVRGAKNALIVGDMPFMTYHVDTPDALRNAARFIQEAGAQAIKLEGGVTVAETVKRVVDCGIPVMGHIGMTPQSVYQFGGFKSQGKTLETARGILNDALALEKAGVFCIVLESVPFELSRFITEQIGVPTIGIGAGPWCDGQIQVINDILGLYTDFVPKHTKQYAHIADVMKDAISNYSGEVKGKVFPTEKNSYIIDEKIIKELQGK